MSPPLFIQQYTHAGLPQVRQIWRAARLKYVFNRSLVDQSLYWMACNPQWEPEVGQSMISASDLILWCSKRASTVGRTRALEKSALNGNTVVLQHILTHTDPKNDLSALLCICAQTKNWNSVALLCNFAHPNAANTALIAAVEHKQVHLLAALVAVSTTSVINRALNLAAQSKQPAAVALLVNHCAEWARTDALGQALMNDCVDSVHMLAPLSDCWLVKDWAHKELKSGWEKQNASIALHKYTQSKIK